MATTTQPTRLVEMEFEVFGKVQRVFFRKNTKEEADSRNLMGWCENQATGTVKGVAQGPLNQIESFEIWLKTKGSPSSIIEKCETRISPIAEYTFEDFQILRRKLNKGL